MGHRVSGSDLARLPHARAAARCSASTRASVTTPATSPTASTRVIVSTAIAASRTPRSARAASSACPCCSRADTLRAIVAAAAHGRGRREPRQDHDVVDARARSSARPGWHPSFLIGGDLNEVGTNAAWDDGEWLVVEADESDGTFLELAPEAAIVTNIEARPPRRTTATSRARRRVRAVRRRHRPVPAWSAPTTPSPPASPANAGTTIVTYGFADDADYRIRDYVGKRNGSQFVLARRGDSWATSSSCRCPVATTRRTPPRAAAMALEIGVPFDAVRARPRRVRRSGPPVPVPGRARRRHLRRRLRAPPGRSGRT